MKRQELILSGTIENNLKEEVFTKERPIAYVGFESSGSLHLGHLTIILKLRDLQKANFKVIVFLSSFHAQLNNKSSDSLKSLEIIRELKGCRFLDQENLEFITSDEIVTKEYLLEGLMILGHVTLNRLKRTLTINTREDAYKDNLRLLLYPIYQMLDIKVLNIDLALGGMDQRNIHVLFNEIHNLFKRPKVSYIHTPLLPSLSNTIKMSKSLGNVLHLGDNLENIRKIFIKAYFDYRTHSSPFLEGVLNLINMYEYTDINFSNLCSELGVEHVVDYLVMKLDAIFDNFR